MGRGAHSGEIETVTSEIVRAAANGDGDALRAIAWGRPRGRWDPRSKPEPRRGPDPAGRYDDGEIGPWEAVGPWRDCGEVHGGYGSLLAQPVRRAVRRTITSADGSWRWERGVEHATRPVATLNTSQHEIAEIDDRTPRDGDAVCVSGIA